MLNHFYPIQDLTANQLKMWFRNDSNCYKSELTTVEMKITPKVYTIQVIESKDTFQTLLDVMTETNTCPFPFKNKISFDGNTIQNFIIGETKYVLTNTEDETYQQKLVKDYCKLNDEIYSGQSIGAIVSDIIKSIYPKVPKSTPNPNIYKSLNTENVKYRTHYGSTGVEINENSIAADLNKSYPSVMFNPLDDFIFLDFNNEWEKFDGKLDLGLYYVETNDYQLLHGTNIYSNKIIELALAENLITEINIKFSLKTKPSVPKDFLKKIFF